MRAEGKDPSHGGTAKQMRAATHAEQMRLNKEWEANPTHAMTGADNQEQALPRLADVPSAGADGSDEGVQGIYARCPSRREGAASEALGVARSVAGQ
jgi:hypothetical protein